MLAFAVGGMFVACGDQCRAPGQCQEAVSVFIRDADGDPVSSFTLVLTFGTETIQLICGTNGGTPTSATLADGRQIIASCGAGVFAVSGIAGTTDSLDAEITSRFGTFDGRVQIHTSTGETADAAGCTSSCVNGVGSLRLALPS